MTQEKEIQAEPVEQVGRAAELDDRAPRRTAGRSLLGFTGFLVGKRLPLGRPLLNRR